MEVNRPRYDINARRVALQIVDGFKYIHSQNRLNILAMDRGSARVGGTWSREDGSLPAELREAGQYFSQIDPQVLINIASMQATRIGLGSLPEEADDWLDQIKRNDFDPKHALARVIFHLGAAELELFRLGYEEYQRMHHTDEVRLPQIPRFPQSLH